MKRTILLDPNDTVKGKDGEDRTQLEDYDLLEVLLDTEKDKEKKIENENENESEDENENENENDIDNENENDNEKEEENANQHQLQQLPLGSPKKRSRRTLKEVKHPKPDIPRPRNAWIIYRSHKSKELREAAASKSNSRVISATVSDMWKNETVKVKNDFLKLADDEKKMHKVLWPEYKYKPRRPAEEREVQTTVHPETPPPLRRKKRSEERDRGRPRKSFSHSRSQSDDLPVRYPLYNPTLTPTPIPIPTQIPIPTPLLTPTPNANSVLPTLATLPSSPDKGYLPDFLGSPFGSPPSSYPGSQSEFLNSPQDFNIGIPALEYLPPDFNFDNVPDLFADIEALFNKPPPNHNQASCFFNASQDFFK